MKITKKITKKMNDYVLFEIERRTANRIYINSRKKIRCNYENNNFSSMENLEFLIYDGLEREGFYLALGEKEIRELGLKKESWTYLEKIKYIEEKLQKKLDKIYSDIKERKDYLNEKEIEEQRKEKQKEHEEMENNILRKTERFNGITWFFM